MIIQEELLRNFGNKLQIFIRMNTTTFARTTLTYSSAFQLLMGLLQNIETLRIFT